MKKIVTAILVVGFLAIAVVAGSEYATCPYDGEQASRINVEEIHSDSCPGDLYNAERDTYRHTHISNGVLEVHTFSTVECLRRNQ
jgi:hypothetical protein